VKVLPAGEMGSRIQLPVGGKFPQSIFPAMIWNTGLFPKKTDTDRLIFRKRFSNPARWHGCGR